MPGKERTRRPGDGQLDLTSLIADGAVHRDFGVEPALQDAEAGAQRRLQTAAAALERTLGDPEAARWAHSPYRWIRDLATGRKSKAAERLVAAALADTDLLVTPAAGPGHSFLVRGHRVKVRMSMRWASGEFVFQQVLSGDYDHACLLGIAPERVWLWLAPRDLLLERVDAGTGWLSFAPDRPPAWLDPCGGPASAGLDLLRTLEPAATAGVDDTGDNGAVGTAGPTL